MSNVIQLNARRTSGRALPGPAAMVASFAGQRRFGDDVFWLKENAELLNILECTGESLDTEALAPHLGFYEQIEQRLEFFPQYYRFLLSLCLDLEDLGMEGAKGEALAHWIARQGLPEAELSDLQRAEARRLLRRRGAVPMSGDDDLTERLHRFVSRSETFALPNKKAAYELTHIVFYLSEYGRKNPELPEQALISLEYSGILAYLEQNADLLAEICVALRYAGATPSPIWENWILRMARSFSAGNFQGAHLQDDYHEYLVCGWAARAAGAQAFHDPVGAGAVSFLAHPAPGGPLREISECIFLMGNRRSNDWGVMSAHVRSALGQSGHDILSAAEASSPHFESFFAGFARAVCMQVAV
ncbi:DUF6902 family protein [Ruegeria marina]|uniref:Uncharacterized protein n=1 Tax=Ruegeria marina TaxID=639004 RepID=A0A1G6JSU4_9RHOB|nr:hypothetical protein [Ruegeria marina]SDC21763.1 hypothetical protein SAMN04488239_101429 [Ruegeria marina]